MTAKDYDLKPSNTVLSHGPDSPRLLRDFPDPGSRVYMDKLVASGHYFVDLADELNYIRDLVANNPGAAKMQLEQTAKKALYLDQKYQLVNKPAS